MATASAMSVDELFSYIQGLFAHLFQKFADFTYENYRQEFGIKDPIKEKFLGFSDLFHEVAILSNITHSCYISDEDRHLIDNLSYKLLDILDFLWKEMLNIKNININDCKKVSNKVEVLDGFQHFFAWTKIIQAQSACIFLKQLADNATVSEDTRNSYKKYFDTIIKLYENRILSNEEDKAAFKESMNFLLKQVNATQLPSGAKNAITQLTQVFIKIITGEKLTFLDNWLILKNGVVLVISQFNGNTYSLWKDTGTTELGISLFPIILNVYLSEGLK